MPPINPFSPKSEGDTPPPNGEFASLYRKWAGITERLVNVGPLTGTWITGEVRPRSQSVNPEINEPAPITAYQPVMEGRPHPGGLGKSAVIQLYNAMSFKTLRDERGFNTFITISAEYLGLAPHAKFAALMPVMNKAIKGWLNARPKRSARYRQIEPLQHSYLYVLERGGEHGLHCHLICSVPRELRGEFRSFLSNWWQRQTGRVVPANAIDVKFLDRRASWAQYEQQAVWFRYLIKTMRSDMPPVYDRHGRQFNLETVMKPWRREGMRPDLLPIRVRQIYGISRDLDTKARQDWGDRVGWPFQSKFEQGRFDELYSGSEVRTFVPRQLSFPDWWREL